MSEENRLFKKKRFTGKAFTLKVGADLGEVEEFSVHEVVLKETSGFFKAATKKEWKEGAERVINMPEDKPEVVSAYIDWLYTDKVFSKSGELPKTADEHAEHSVHLAKLYAFGEKNQDDSFCDAVITAWTRHIGTKLDGTFYFFSTTIINEVYAGTLSGSPARKFVVQSFAIHGKGHPNWLHNYTDWNTPALSEFVWDLALEQLKNKGDSNVCAADLFDQRKQWFKKR